MKAKAKSQELLFQIPYREDAVVYLPDYSGVYFEVGCGYDRRLLLRLLSTRSEPLNLYWMPESYAIQANCMTSNEIATIRSQHFHALRNFFIHEDDSDSRIISMHKHFKDNVYTPTIEAWKKAKISVSNPTS